MRGSVYKRGSTWTWHIDVGVDPVTGKRKQQTKGGFKTRRECQAALNEALTALRSGAFVEPSKRTLGSFLVDEWLPAVHNVRPSTFSNYRTHIRTYIVPALGAVPLQRLSPAQLNAFYKALLAKGRLRDGQGMAPKTVHNVHAILHRALKDAVRLGYVARNVADAVDPPKGLAAERQVWTPEQLRVFLNHVREDRLYAAWLLVATTAAPNSPGCAGSTSTSPPAGSRPAGRAWWSTTPSWSPTPRRPRAAARWRSTRPPSPPSRGIGSARPRRRQSWAPAIRTRGSCSPCRTDHRSTRSGSPPGSCSTPAQPGCPGSGCMMSATAMPPRRWRPVSRRR